MGWLSTHVLDTARGRPAQGLRITLWRIGEADGLAMTPVQIAEMQTNADGRTDAPILPEADFRPGIYELTFHAGEWLREEGLAGDEPLFLDTVPVRFGMAADDHYHVPLLLSPYGFSTYRGS
ncbi:MAG: hydroxyisourate hydrolase [Hasllibacter sp.]